ncbi:hypothetical protein AMS68_002093 [Peltaster fructicola]|uniref:Sin3-associated polypeptide Sap18 n=1 Tax=Peltaster fructicola TaxID=286661 RepID=A0A6H0XPG6_9PEZI|nr:hypothetical protein AMS68_002093 [Peltaster fructicola]
MALQPSAGEHVDRTTQAPFLLRLFWRSTRSLDPYEFSIAPPSDLSRVTDYYSLLPYNIRSQSVEIYTWPSCTLRELTGLLTSVLAPGTLPEPAVGTRLIYKLIFPDTRAQTSESGQGKWIDKPLGTVTIGGADGDEYEQDFAGQLRGDADKTLADARFVIGDYIACSIYPPGSDPRPPPAHSGRPGRGENGFGSRGGYRGGYGGRGSGGSGPPTGEWRRGERPPGGGYNGGRGRPY